MLLIIGHGFPFPRLRAEALPRKHGNDKIERRHVASAFTADDILR